MNYQIIITDEDLQNYPEDTDLYLKIYNDLQENCFDLPPFNELNEDIVREINIAKGRILCKVCDGAGMVGNLKCIGIKCNGRGYID